MYASATIYLYIISPHWIGAIYLTDEFQEFAFPEEIIEIGFVAIVCFSSCNKDSWATIHFTLPIYAIEGNSSNSIYHCLFYCLVS